MGSSGLPAGPVPVARPVHKAEAVTMRVTPALLEALRAARAAGIQATVRFGGSVADNCIRIGEQVFPFSCVPEGRCDVLQVQGATVPRATLVAQATRKAIVSRNVADERARMRAKSVAAERASDKRKAQLLDSARPRAGARGATRSASPSLAIGRSSSPTPVRVAVNPAPAAGRGARTSPPAPLVRPSSPLVRPSSPLVRPSSPLVRPPSPRPDLASAGATRSSPAPLARAASPAPSLERSSAPPRSPRAAPSAGVPTDQALAAARAGGLRGLLLALLAERPASLQALRTSVALVSRRVPGLAAQTQGSALERAVKSVATFVPPGRYALKPELQGEAERAVAGAASGNVCRDAIPPTAFSGSRGGTTASDDRAECATGGSGGGGGSGAGTGGGAVAGGAASRKRKLSDEGSPNASISAASSESLEGPPRARVAGDRGREAGEAGESPRRASSEEASWVGELCSRQPRRAPRLSTPEEYAALEASFNRRYEQYFSLHRTLESHRSNAEAWREALADPALGEDARRDLERRLEAAWRRRRHRIERADAAFRVLHVELEDAKARLGEYAEGVGRGAAGKLGVGQAVAV